MMEIVKQMDGSGCGIACVAMVTRMDYAAVRRIWLDCLLGDSARLDRVGDGLPAGEIIHLLAYIGVREMNVEYNGFWRISEKDSWTIFDKPTEVPCIRHWVVHAGGKVYDPALASSNECQGMCGV